MYDRVTTSGMTPRAVGSQGMPNLTFMHDRPMTHESPEAEVGVAPSQQGNPQFFLAAFVVALAVLWLARNNSEALQREVVGLNLYNFLIWGFSVVLFIMLGKILTARFPVPGLTPLFASV